MAAGLQMAMVFDGPLGVGAALDYALPERTTTPLLTPSWTPGLYGVQVNCGFNVAGTALQISPAVPDCSPLFSWSSLMLFDGSAHGSIGFAAFGGAAVGAEYVIAGATTAPLQVGSPDAALSSTVILGSLTGWHRVGCTVNGAACRFFLDGQFTDAETLSGATLALGSVTQLLGCTGDSSSWGWNTADMFLWSRQLSDTEMALHYQAPYRSVLRPRGSELNLVGRRRRGGLLLQGVGP